MKSEINPLYKNISEELNLGEIVSVEVIQSLWGGYGELVRVCFKENSMIVKHIKLPKTSSHPRGWNTNLSHKRKLHSYKVETNWYENFSNPSDERCRIPKGLKCFEDENEWLIVMEDLATIGYTNTTFEADEEHLISCINWLANFHGKYMGKRSEQVWEIGTYWHLDTRPDELKVLKDMELKRYAKAIDSKLNSAKYQTILHGDAKLANFCFTKDAMSCAAVDFQYVGHGCGMKDLIYFISSAIDPKSCEELEEWVLDIYFLALLKALERYKVNLDYKELEKEWRELYPIAWADFLRFIKGWSPEHFKINSYSQKMTDKALAYLNQE